jgi:bifunctional NMN adenylyltransferase/nudix hydrolase
MTEKYRHGIFIGRFQPFHTGHAAVIRQMYEECNRVTIIIGSAYCRPNFHRNPFSIHERRNMVSNFIEGELREYSDIVMIEDRPYDDQKWAAQIEKYLAHNSVMYCHEKEDTTYFKFFPDVKKVFVETAANGISATKIRQMYFAPGNYEWVRHVPESNVDYLKGLQETPWYAEMLREKEMVKDYKAQFAGLPYPVSFNTGDALVTCKSRVLMIKRGQFPAKGSLALPGGFLNVSTDASLVDCALRELKEETKIKVPPAVLRGSIKQVRTFDHMHRDPRGRIITTAVHIDVSNEIGYPSVKAEDDAAEAIWIPRHKIRREDCFGDHYDIIDTMIGLDRAAEAADPEGRREFIRHLPDDASDRTPIRPTRLPKCLHKAFLNELSTASWQ